MDHPSLTFIIAPSGNSGLILRLSERGESREQPYSLEYQKSIFSFSVDEALYLEDEFISKSRKHKISAYEANKIFHMLNEAKISAKPAHVRGRDGTDYALIVDNGFNAVKYKWWVRIPEEWEALGEIANAMLRLAGEKEISW